MKQMTLREIAEQLGISERQAQYHLDQGLQKCRLKLMAQGIRRKTYEDILVPDEPRSPTWRPL